MPVHKKHTHWWNIFKLLRMPNLHSTINSDKNTYWQQWTKAKPAEVQWIFLWSFFSIFILSYTENGPFLGWQNCAPGRKRRKTRKQNCIATRKLTLLHTYIFIYVERQSANSLRIYFVCGWCHAQLQIHYNHAHAIQFRASPIYLYDCYLINKQNF